MVRPSSWPVVSRPSFAARADQDGWHGGHACPVPVEVRCGSVRRPNGQAGPPYRHCIITTECTSGRLLVHSVVKKKSAALAPFAGIATTLGRRNRGTPSEIALTDSGTRRFDRPCSTVHDCLAALCAACAAVPSRETAAEAPRRNRHPLPGEARHRCNRGQSCPLRLGCDFARII
jgi:hypothetical protein